MPNIVVVGSINYDVFLDVHVLPKPNETVIGTAMRTAIGGKGLNQAIACARLGATTDMVAAVGHDTFADQALNFLADNGVGTEHVRRLDGTTTGVANILVAADGQNMIVVTPGANGRLSDADVDAAHDSLLKASALVVQLETPLTTVRHALRLARQNGLITVLNPAPVDRDVMDFMALCDVVTPNETELMRLTGIASLGDDDLKAGLVALIQAGAKQAVVTLGVAGCATLIDGNLVRLPAYRVNAVDATGAGDVFNGALTVRLTLGDAWPDALRYALAAASLSVTKPTANACPTPAEVADIMARGV